MNIDEEISNLEQYAKTNNVPIMQKDGIDYLCTYIKKHNIKTILEVGSAIGYSAIKMALVSKDIKLITLEKDKERYLEAIKNINKLSLSSSITIYNEDAVNFEPTTKFDLIFIDAAKGKNTLFFNKFTSFLNNNGIIVTDNLSFHGLVEDPLLIKTKNQRQLVTKIKDYISFLKANNDFVTTFVSCGDKISVSQRKW